MKKELTKRLNIYIKLAKGITQYLLTVSKCPKSLLIVYPLGNNYNPCRHLTFII